MTGVTASRPPSDERSRARHPDESGTIERDGVRVVWDRYGDGSPTILLLPTWSIIHSRFWKFQVPYLARRFRVLTFDGRGNGRSDRPTSAEAYAADEFAADALAVLDATGTSRAVIVSLSLGATWALRLAADAPDRVAGAVFLGPALPLAQMASDRAAALAAFDADQLAYEGWAKYNRHHWRRDYRDFLEFFFSECFAEPHSTKPIEDCVGWGLETSGETLIRTQDAPGIGDQADAEALIGRVRCPVLVVHGSDDRIRPHEQGAELAARSRGTLVTFEGSGHIVNAREPVRTNLEIRAFVESLARLEP